MKKQSKKQNVFVYKQKIMADIFIVGRVETPTQTNITSVGVLSGLQTSGTTTLSNVYMNSLNIDPIRIGVNAGQTATNSFAISIGNSAGQTNQGTNSIAIGYLAGQTNQNQNTIVLNASGTVVNTTTNSAFYVHPIRNQSASTTSYIPLTYNTTSKEIICSTELNLGGDLTVDTNVLVADATNKRVGINQATPTVGFQYTGTNTQLGLMMIGNNEAGTQTLPRTMIFLDDVNRRMLFQNNGYDIFTIYDEGWLVLNTQAVAHPSALSGFYAFTGNNVYLASNTGSLNFRNTSTNTDIFTIGNTGNVSIPVSSSFHTSLNSNQQFGYATAQTTGSGASLYGPFRRTSQSYTTLSNGASSYDFTFNDGATNPNALFYPTSIDNCGGIINVYLKKLGSPSSGTGILNVYIAKRVGVDLSNSASFTLLDSYCSNITTPTLGGGTGNVLRMNFNTTDTTSPNSMNICWQFDGFI